MRRSWVWFSIAVVAPIGTDMSVANAIEQCTQAPVLETFIPDIIDGSAIEQIGAMSKGDSLSGDSGGAWRMERDEDGSQSIIYCDPVTGRCETIMKNDF